MKERPILFSAPMVRAILSGAKTQTRRALRVQPLDVLPMKGKAKGRGWVALLRTKPEPHGTIFRCRHGEPGDRLWVRESWKQTASGRTPMGVLDVFYRATDSLDVEEKWRPSIFMPRWASRLTVELLKVRVERLQSISRKDAIAEGARFLPLQEDVPGAWWTCDVSTGAALHARDPISAYRLLWESINGAESWAANPWVWVLEFRRIKP